MSPKKNYSEKLRFPKVDFKKIKSFREDYLDRLYEAQELYLEMIIETSDYYLIEEDKTIGYLFVAAPLKM